jgi:hypothetical protein
LVIEIFPDLDPATIAFLNLTSIMITLVSAVVGAGFYLEKRANNKLARPPIASLILSQYDRPHPTNHMPIEDRDIKYARDNIKISFSDTNDHRMYLMCAVCKKVFCVDDPERWGKIEGGGIWKCNDHKYHAIPAIEVKESINTLPDTSSIHEMPKKVEKTKYRMLGSPDIYAVQYHDTGHIIKTEQDFNTEEITDIREIDNKGEFNKYYKKRLYPKQLR